MKPPVKSATPELPEEPELKPDRTLKYMGIGLGMVILVMGYFTFFVDDPGSIFSGKEEVIQPVVENRSQILEENAGMNDSEVRISLTKFIEAFYYDQRRGYFDPPSYFSNITQTYYNYHNLTHKRLRDIHYKRLEDMRNLSQNWIVSSLKHERNDNLLVATYWLQLNYYRPSKNKEESCDVKMELMIDREGKIVSMRELETRNMRAYDHFPEPDTLVSYSDQSQPVNQPAETPAPSIPAAPEVPEARYEGRLYDLGTVETVPEFPGGARALARYMGLSIRYPAAARDNNIQGKVYVSFIVERNGDLSDLKIVRGIGGGCDEEALRVLRSSPAWKPGTAGGRAVRTSYVQPITFQLAN